MKYKPIVLIILDGWGLSPSWGGNALAVANPINMNRLWRDYPHKVLQAFTMVAGKYGVVGDSRLGHSTIAAGRRIPQDLEIISEAIAKRRFYKNKILIEAINHCIKHKSNLHLIGLLSIGGVHSHLRIVSALLELCWREKFKDVFLDLITDGIDGGANDTLNLIEDIQTKIKETGIGQFSSLVGRFYAMDRSDNFKLTRKAYELWVEGKGQIASTVSQAISQSYRLGFNDFNLPATLIQNIGKTHLIQDDDAVICFNFRGDRSVQLVKMLTGTGGHQIFWKPKKLSNLFFVTFTEYQKGLPVKVAFPRKEAKETLGEILASHEQKQLRVAESEKTAHVTTFFNCGHDTPFPREERKIVPSLSGVNPAKNPELSAPQIAREVLKAISSNKYDFILVNFANVDILSHSGDFRAAGTAIRTVDSLTSTIAESAVSAGGAAIITADHGNIEQMIKLNPQQDPEARHTLNPVPFILVTKEGKKDLIKGAVSTPYSTLSKIITAKETLADIAPTILELLGLPRPEVMTGHSLLNKLE